MQISKGNEILKFWIKVLVVFIVVFLFSRLCGGIADSALKYGFSYAYPDKLEILKNEQGEKTVFVGGSSALFGVVAEYYEELSGKPAVNMGLNAGVYDVYLACVEPYVNSGDTVVLAFEFAAYTGEWYNFDKVFLNVAEASKEYSERISLKHRPKYMFKLCLHNCTKLFDVFYESLRSKLDNSDALYVRENIDKYGDLKKGLADGTKNATRLEIETKIDNESTDEILKYIKKMEDKGVKVYIAYPPCYAEPEADEIKEMDEQLREIFGERIIGDINDWLYDNNENFFDTGYHLNGDAAMMHTEYYYNLIQQEN